MSLNSSTNKNEAKTSTPSIQPIVPMSRVKTIMKSSPEISIINQDTLYLVCKATVRMRFFIRLLSLNV
jgi:hypothetical protein